ncbi:MAG: AbrB/MazE/SpoVT family DNA-binding domain-containing protein [Gammaproteobacteria bacterium]|nr:AbrB/MazE/SpoVT family DNA-binding domain-containing protein [Gammaproteobacteria bacterium]
MHLTTKTMNATLTRDGRVTIPKHIWDLLGLGAGSPVVFKLTDDEQVLLLAADREPSPGRFGRFRDVATVKMSTDDIMALTRGKGQGRSG